LLALWRGLTRRHPAGRVASADGGDVGWAQPSWIEHHQANLQQLMIGILHVHLLIVKPHINNADC